MDAPDVVEGERQIAREVVTVRAALGKHSSHCHAPFARICRTAGENRSPFSR